MLAQVGQAPIAPGGEIVSSALIESQGRPSEGTPEEALYEVVNGQRVELPPMGVYSSFIALRLFLEAAPYTHAHRLGIVVAEVLFILDPVHNLRRRPDVAFVSAERWPLDRPIPEEGDWEVVPDLAVEVTSTHDLWDEVLAKMHEYFEKGVRQVWIVVPKRQQVFVFESPTRVHILTTAEELDGGDLLRGFRLPLTRLFQRQMDTGTPPQVSHGSTSGAGD
jgi:Uma2 family endonuclease